MILLDVDLEALLHGIVHLEALDDLEGDEELSETWEDEYGFQELEVSHKGELLFLNHTLIGGEEEFDWLIETSKVFKGRYSVPKLEIENVPLYEVLRKLKEYVFGKRKNNPFREKLLKPHNIHSYFYKDNGIVAFYSNARGSYISRLQERRKQKRKHFKKRIKRTGKYNLAKVRSSKDSRRSISKKVDGNKAPLESPTQT